MISVAALNGANSGKVAKITIQIIFLVLRVSELYNVKFIAVMLNLNS